MTHPKSDIPEGISQEAWDAAVASWNQGRGIADIARAIMAAKAEEREACAKDAKDAHRIDRPENDLQIGAIAGCFAAAAAIRKRGEA